MKVKAGKIQTGKAKTGKANSRHRKVATPPLTTRNKRQQIVDAAIDVFLRHGYSATTLLKVAEEAGVIRATIYSHFPDKEALFAAIIEELTINRLGPNLEESIQDLSPREFVLFLRDMVKRRSKDKQYLALLRTVIGESERFPELSRMYFNTIYSKGMTIAHKYLHNHKELRFKDPMAASIVVCGSMMAWLIQQELLHGKEIAPMSVDAVADTIIDLLSPRIATRKR